MWLWSCALTQFLSPPLSLGNSKGTVTWALAWRILLGYSLCHVGPTAELRLSPDLVKDVFGIAFSFPRVLDRVRLLLVAQLVKNPPAVWETWVWSLGWEDPLEKGKATYSSILAWRSPWTVQPMGCRVRHNWATFTFTSVLLVVWSIWELPRNADSQALPTPKPNTSDSVLTSSPNRVTNFLGLHPTEGFPGTGDF